MADSGITHKDIGVQMTREEWEASDSHTITNIIIPDGAGHYHQLPSLTTTQRDALTPVNGMVIYNSTTTQVEAYQNGSWGAMGYTAFLQLADTPASFSGESLKNVRVNVGETALEFSAAAGIPDEIEDADQDTGIEVEKNADEDIIRMRTAGNEAFHLSATGKITLVLQSGGKAYRAATNFYVDRETTMPVSLNAEEYDTANEWNTTAVRSTATAGTAGTTLVDSSNPFSSGDVGKDVWNTTVEANKGEHTTIAAYVSASQVTLTADIGIDSGDTYEMNASRFTVTEAGVYACAFNVYYGVPTDGTRYDVRILKNGGTAGMGRLHSGHAGVLIPFGAAVIKLAANDYLQLGIHHNGVADSIYIALGTGYYSYFEVTKIA